ncbi:WWE domain family protein [Acanthocheilonema viteae]
MEGPIADVDGSTMQYGSEKCDECPICYQEFAYKTELPDCGHKFCFLCIKGVALRHGACPLCRKRIPCSIFLDPVLTTFAEQPTTIRAATAAESIAVAAENIDDSRKKNENKVQWFYAARHGGWWRYESRHENEIEEAYQHGLRSIDLLIAGNLFSINFDSMCQYRKDFSRRGRHTRPVKRIEEGDPGLDGAVRGIAGLRTSIEGNTNMK